MSTDRLHLVVPYSIDRDLREGYGVTALFARLGETLDKRSRSDGRSSSTGPAGTIEDDIELIENMILHAYETEPKHKVWKFCRYRRKKEIHWARLRVISHLTYCLIHGIESVEISKVAAAIVERTGNFADLFESRRIAAGMLLECSLSFADCKTPTNPEIKLADAVIREAIFSKFALPILTPEIISATRELKRERNTHVGFRPNEKKAFQPKGPVADFLSQLPDLSPQQMDRKLEQRGYCFQEQARRSVCVAAYRHVHRLRQIHLQGVEPKEIPHVGHQLFCGPTGSGKTHLARLLYQEELGLPAVQLDITKFSETGFVGLEISSILTQIFLAAESNVELAQIGIVILDEFDKIAHPTGNGNGGSGPLVSRDGVQRGLLKLLEPSIHTVPSRLGPSWRSDTVDIKTDDLLFLSLGCFGSMQEDQANHSGIGFADNGGAANQTSYVDELVDYGLMPELIGRFGNMVRFNPLSRDHLKHILHKHTLEKFKIDLKRDGIDLIWEDSVADLIADRSIAMKTGARGIGSVLSASMSEILFHAYSEKDISEIWLYVTDGELKWELGRKSTGQKKTVKHPPQKATVDRKQPPITSITA